MVDQKMDVWYLKRLIVESGKTRLRFVRAKEVPEERRGSVFVRPD
jgi:hypothetical protein